jgi:hypothetical protein
VHFVDKALAKVLLDDIDSASKPNIFAIGGFASALECGSDTFRDEVKRSSTIHDKRCTSVVSQYEYGDVIHRILAPPTSPPLVWPGSTNRPEHVSSQNPGADVVETSCSNLVINACFSAVAAENFLLKRPSGERPAVKGGSPPRRVGCSTCGLDQRQSRLAKW